jgi:hypothetical protein
MSTGHISGGSWHKGRGKHWSKAESVTVPPHRLVDTYTRRQNNGRRRVVQFRDIEWLGEEVRGIQLVERDGTRSLRSLGSRLRGEEMRICHAHCPKLLGHLCDTRSSGSSICLSRVCAIGSRLLVTGLLLRVSSVAPTSWQLTAQRGIGTGAKLERLPSICPLLLATVLNWSRGLLLGGRAIGGRLTVPFLGRVTPLWCGHGGLCVRERNEFDGFS